MQEYKCPFSATLIGGQFGCVRSAAVTRRGGPDVACTTAEAAARCARLFEHLKTAALPRLGYADDLTATPHGVYVRIQFGGLLGLQGLLGQGAGERIDDIDALVSRLEARPGGIAALPCEGVVETIAAHKRRGRR